MPAGGGNRITAYEHLGSGYLARLDRIPQRKYCVTVGAQVADRGESPHQGPPRIHLGVEGNVRIRHGDDIELVAAAGLEGKMHMQIDKPGHYEPVGKVDDPHIPAALNIRRPGITWPDFRNPAVTYDDALLRDRFRTGNRKQCPRVDDRGAGRNRVFRRFVIVRGRHIGGDDTEKQDDGQ